MKGGLVDRFDDPADDKPVDPIFVITEGGLVMRRIPIFRLDHKGRPPDTFVLLLVNFGLLGGPLDRGDSGSGSCFLFGRESLEALLDGR